MPDLGAVSRVGPDTAAEGTTTAAKLTPGNRRGPDVLRVGADPAGVGSL